MKKEKHSESTAENKTEDNAATIKNEKTKPAVQNKSRLSLATILAAFAVIVAVTAGTESVIRTNKLIHFENKLAQQQSLSAQQSLQATQQVSNFSSSITALQAQITKQNQVISDLSSNSQAGQTQAVLIQADHLYRLADFVLKYQQDVPSALSLLQTTKQLLITQNNPDLLPLQQSVANDILTLQSLPAIDITDLMTQISAVSNQVKQIPITNPSFAAKPASTTTQPTVNEKTKNHWYEKILNGFKSAWQELNRFIIIQNHQQPVKPFITPSQQLLLQENWQLMLTQAQWALLHANQNLYVFLLQQVQTQLNQYATLASPQTQAIQAALTKLIAQKISLPAVDFSNTENLINQLKENTTTTTPANNTPAPAQATPAPAPATQTPPSSPPATPAPSSTTSGEVSL